MGKKRNVINVSVAISNGLVKIKADEYTIELVVHSSIEPNKVRLDFAAWFILPIAMRCNADILIHGAGTQETTKNANLISSIWEAWMPDHFNSINVFFTEECSVDDFKKDTGSLFFYSGGADSTYSLLKLAEENKSQSLLTVQGMDYTYKDEDRFNKLIEKTDRFAKEFGSQRLYIKTNAYSIYDKFKINTKSSHISHIFALTGSAFMFSEHFKNIIISSDLRLDQQFLVHPWGSNSATNKFFNDGSTSLQTVDDDVTRSDKMKKLQSSEVALSSLSFCIDYKSRPENCGVCSKCMRTKLMFLAATGRVPKIFNSIKIDATLIEKINLSKKSEVASFIDLYNCAKNNEMLDKMPYLIQTFEELKSNVKPTTTRNKNSKTYRKILDLFRFHPKKTKN